MSFCAYEEICKHETLVSGWERVRSKRGCAGVDGVTINKFAKHGEKRIHELARELREHVYQPLPLRRHVIPKKNGFRNLDIPSVRDRVVQSAALLVIRPLMEAMFQPCSYGYRPGRSYKDAVRAIEQLRDAGKVWVVEADIARYFDSIDRTVLQRQLERTTLDRQIIQLLVGWMAPGKLHRGRLIRPPVGIPQGSCISPLLANLYLNPFDSVLLAQQLNLVRFADDFVILCEHEAEARPALNAAKRALGILDLNLKARKTRITSFDKGFEFLGTRFEGNQAKRLNKRKNMPQKQTRNKHTAQPAQRGNREIRRNSIEAVNNRRKTASSEAPEGDNAASSHMRTLYIQEHGSRLECRKKRWIVSKGNEERLSVPSHKIRQIVIFGHTKITPYALNHALIHDTPITLLSSQGKYFGRIESTLAGNISRERWQFRRAEDPAFCLNLARSFVYGKLRNYRAVLHRQQHSTEKGYLQETTAKLNKALRRIQSVDSLASLRGVEGAATAAYFRAYGRLFKNEVFSFDRRIRRPPPDPVNTLLSFGYTLLFYNVFTALRSERLNPYVGIYHASDSGHPACVSDLMEEFRSLVDVLVLRMINKRMLQQADFEIKRGKQQACYLSVSARKRFIEAFERTLQRLVFHQEVQRKISYRECLTVQVDCFRQHLEGKRVYQPFRWR